jgi:hypothetical protein
VRLERRRQRRMLVQAQVAPKPYDRAQLPPVSGPNSLITASSR